METSNYDENQFSPTVDQMEEIRQNRAAYDYLCRLYEVQKWLVGRLEEFNIPPPIDLEEDLRNGIILARLANTFLPNFVKHIYDIEEERYESNGLVYNHTDNIIQWRKACLQIGFPEFWIPETVDVYEGRNVRTIFCLHALANYLHRFQNAVPIKNETGNLEFMQEDIEIAKQRLHTEGVTNCDFRQTVVSHITVKADVIEEIKNAIENSSSEELMKVLSEPKNGFVFVKINLGEKYFNKLVKGYQQDETIDSKKVQSVVNKVNGGEIRARNIRGNRVVLEKEALHQLEAYLKASNRRNFDELSDILTNFDSEKVIEAAMPFYDEYLFVNCKDGSIEPQQLRHVMDECNACVQLKTSLKEGDVDDVFESLKNPFLNLEDVVYNKNKEEYYQTLLSNVHEFDYCILTLSEKLRRIIIEINLINKLRYYALNNNLEGFENFILKIKVDGYNHRYCDTYMNEIKQNGIKNKEDLRKVVEKVNKNMRALMEDKLKNKNLDFDDIREVVSIQSEISYEEEILIEKRRSKVASLIEVNEKLKDDMEDLEKSFQLFKNNEISIHEILKHIEVIKMEEDDVEQRQVHEQTGLQRLSLNPLEILFYYLQTDPTLLANLFSWNKINSKDFVHNIVFPLFYFAKGEREEILLVRGFAKLLTRYISGLKSPSQFLVDSCDDNKIIISFKEMLQALPASNQTISLFSKSDLTEFQKAEAAEEHLNFSPIQMYEKLHNKHAKSLDEATNDPEVAKILKTSKNFLAKWTLLFTKKAAESLEIPKNVRYLLKICANKLRRQFKNLEKKEADRLVAKFFYATFFVDYLQAHNKKEIDSSLTNRQKEILQLIIHMMELGADGKGFGDDFAYMQPLNSTLIHINEIFTSITSNHLIRQGSAFTLNREPLFNESGIKHVLHIETKYVHYIVDSLQACKDMVFPDPQSKLRPLLHKVKVPNNEAVILFLKPLSENKEHFDGGLLMIETKKILLELLKLGCKGSNIKELLESDISIDDEETNGYGEVGGEKEEMEYETIREKKDALSHNLSQLEKFGVILSKNNYDDVMQQISHDLTAKEQIHNQNNQQLEALDRKINELKAKNNEYQDQVEEYRRFLEKYQK